MSSTKSRHSIAYQTSHFNPIRFLAMALIEKNQERKELERKKQLLEVKSSEAAAIERSN